MILIPRGWNHHSSATCFKNNQIHRKMNENNYETDEDFTPCLLLLIPTYSLCFELHQSGSYTPFEYPKQKE